jgi:hypothetical protein
LGLAAWTALCVGLGFLLATPDKEGRLRNALAGAGVACIVWGGVLGVWLILEVWL